MTYLIMHTLFQFSKHAFGLMAHIQLEPWKLLMMGVYSKEERKMHPTKFGSQPVFTIKFLMVKIVIGDSLYKGVPETLTISMPGHDKAKNKLINQAKARQECYHGHTKKFNVMKHWFRHGNQSADLKLSMDKTCRDTIHILMHFKLINCPLMDVPWAPVP